MEPLAALGAAAAAVQFVDFGTRLLSTSWEVYKDGTGREVKDFKVVLQDLRRLKKGYSTGAKENSIDPPSLDFPSSILAARDLFNYCVECDAVATQLEAVLPTTIKRMRSLKHEQITGARFRSALEQVLNRSTIKELHDDLNRIRSGTVDCMVALTWAAMREMPVAITSINDKLDSVMAQLQLNLEGTHSSSPVVQGYICGLSEGLSVESFLRNNNGIETMNEIRRILFSQDLKLNELPHHPTSDSAVSDDQSLAETITSWLKFESMKSRESAIETPYEDTYDWVFSPPIVDQTGKPRWANFHHWLVSTDAEEAPKAYWSTGKPGSGKSTMMKYVANHHKTKTRLETWAAGVHLDIITYYAWKPGRDDLAKSMEGLLRTIFYQLLKEHLELAPIIFPRRWQYILFCHRAGISSIFAGSWYMWELEESLQILLGLELSCLNSKLAIFIDGLDEFTAAPGALCDLVQRLSTNAFMKICVASREWYEFKETFARSPTIRMHLLTEQSITSYVQGQFESPTINNTVSRWRSLYGTRLDDLQAAIISKAEGVFLWVTLVTTALVQDVADHQPIETLECTLDLMRPKIEDLYTSIFYSIPERIRPNTVIMISLLLAALDEKDTSGLYFFLADESRGNPPRLDPSTINHARACTDIEKKILVRTRGIMNYNRKTDQEPTKSSLSIGQHLNGLAQLLSYNPDLLTLT